MRLWPLVMLLGVYAHADPPAPAEIKVRAAFNASGLHLGHTEDTKVFTAILAAADKDEDRFFRHLSEDASTLVLLGLRKVTKEQAAKIRAALKPRPAGGGGQAPAPGGLPKDGDDEIPQIDQERVRDRRSRLQMISDTLPLGVLDNPAEFFDNARSREKMDAVMFEPSPIGSSLGEAGLTMPDDPSIPTTRKKDQPVTVLGVVEARLDIVAPPLVNQEDQRMALTGSSQGQGTSGGVPGGYNGEFKLTPAARAAFAEFFSYVSVFDTVPNVSLFISGGAEGRVNTAARVNGSIEGVKFAVTGRQDRIDTQLSKGSFGVGATIEQEELAGLNGRVKVDGLQLSGRINALDSDNPRSQVTAGGSQGQIQIEFDSEEVLSAAVWKKLGDGNEIYLKATEERLDVTIKTGRPLTQRLLGFDAESMTMSGFYEEDRFGGGLLVRTARGAAYRGTMEIADIGTRFMQSTIMGRIHLPLQPPAGR